MTASDNPITESGLGQSTGVKVLLTSLAGLGSVFFFGIVFGISVGFLEKGSLSLRAGLIGAACVGLGLALAWYAYRKVRTILAEPTGPKTRRARLIMIVSMVLGALIGVFLEMARDRDSAIDAISPTMAVFLAFCALVAIPALTLVWWRALDEHEARAYSDGAIVALNANVAVTAAWWVLAKGGLMEPVQAMPVFLLTIFVWSVVWLWKRYF